MAKNVRGAVRLKNATKLRRTDRGASTSVTTQVKAARRQMKVTHWTHKNMITRRTRDTHL